MFLGLVGHLAPGSCGARPPWGCVAVPRSSPGAAECLLQSPDAPVTPTPSTPKWAGVVLSGRRAMSPYPRSLGSSQGLSISVEAVLSRSCWPAPHPAWGGAEPRFLFDGGGLAGAGAVAVELS